MADKKLKKLISLEQHEELVRIAYWPSCPNGPNGIACPQCQVELLDTGIPFTFMPGAPREVITKCPACDYHSSRRLMPEEAPKPLR